mgnify:CR=1 FL=1
MIFNKKTDINEFWSFMSAFLLIIDYVWLTVLRAYLFRF